MCASTAALPTQIVCALAGLPGGMWHTVVFFVSAGSHARGSGAGEFTEQPCPVSICSVLVSDVLQAVRDSVTEATIHRRAFFMPVDSARVVPDRGYLTHRDHELRVATRPATCQRIAQLRWSGA